MERRVIVTEADVDAVVRAVEARVERYAPGFAGTACGANADRGGAAPPPAWDAGPAPAPQPPG